VLSCVGRRPNRENLGLQAIGVAVDDQGFVRVDAHRMTNVPSIYPIGDVADQPMLARAASFLHEGTALGLHAVVRPRTNCRTCTREPSFAFMGDLQIRVLADGLPDGSVSAASPCSDYRRSVGKSRTRGSNDAKTRYGMEQICQHDANALAVGWLLLLLSLVRRAQLGAHQTAPWGKGACRHIVMHTSRVVQGLRTYPSR